LRHSSNDLAGQRVRWHFLITVKFLSAKSIQLGDLQFATQTAALNHCSDVLNRYPLGARVTEDDTALLLLLLERHPDREQKTGVGVSYFAVRAAELRGRCFWIHRTDGTATDFSFKQCIAPPGLNSCLHKVLRHEVDEDIKLAKQRFFAEHGDELGRVACKETDELITLEDADADHAPPLSHCVLAETFLRATRILTGVELKEESLAPLEDQQFGRQLADRRLAEQWRRYHHELAFVTPEVNSASAPLARPRASDRQLILPMDGGRFA
jgi:hypothetical protein